MPNENDQYSSEDDGGLTVGGIAKDLAVFQASLWGLEMAREGYRHGFYVPGTRGGFGKGTKFYKFGRRHKFLGRRGLQFASPLEPAMRDIYRKAGVLGFRGAKKRAAAAFGVEAAKVGGAKFLLSKAAGMHIGFMILQFGIFGAQLATAGYKAISNQVSKYRGLELGGYFPETQGAYTSRQRALQAITSSNLQAKSAIGNEAFLMHR